MKLKILFYLFLFFSTTLTVVGQNVPEIYGARAAALGNASATQTGAFSVFSNQAGLASTNSITGGIYGENRFLLTDLNLYGVALALPTKSGTFGVGANYYGNEFYNQQRATLGYGRYLYEKLAVGVEFDFLSLNIQDFGSKSAVTFGVGLQYDLNETLKLGVHAFNPLTISFTGIEQDRVASLFKFGLAYEPSDKVGVYIETSKAWHHPAQFRGGIEYYLFKQLVIRGGFSTYPSRIIDRRFSTDLATANFGLGVDLKSLHIDFANRFHPILGHSPIVTIVFKGKEKQFAKVVKEEK